jgi:exopolysaccharide biosynthesis polyprenyl glycosylphosphotransferase
MITHRAKGMAILHSIGLSVAAMTIFWAWVVLHFQVLRSAAPTSYLRYYEYSLLTMAAFAVDYLIGKIRSEDSLRWEWSAVFRASFRQTMVVTGCLLLFLTALHDTSISRLFLFSFLPILFLCLVPLNRRVPMLLCNLIFRGSRRQRTLLYGSSRHARGVADWLCRKAYYGIDIIGMVTDEVTDQQIDDALPCPVLGQSRDLAAIVQKNHITQIIALRLPNSIPRGARIAGFCEKLGVRLLMINDIEQRFNRPIRFFEDDGVQFVSFRDEPLECPLNRAFKRSLDVAIALPVFLFALPILCLVVHLIHRGQSPGPLFYRQRRTGIHFQPFNILKFRTMHAEDHDETVQATRNDHRVFSLGGWLRRLSIDEIPQVINVLRGEMSIVGPRPHMVEHDGQFERVAETYRLRSMVKPGITGLAQIQGRRGETRSSEDIVERVRSDVFYLENWSLGLDGMIIMRTALQMLRPPKTAY